MRSGRNPTKTTDAGAHGVEPPPPVSVALLTHVPYLAGFHADQLDVVRLAVLSARAHAGRPIHLVVVDNGSCPELVGWLEGALERGDIDQLIRNRRNLGKVTGMSQALFGSPGPDVVYADGDLRFLPGWLDAVLEIRDAFPDAAVIGGSPHLERATSSVAPAGTDVRHGSFVPREQILEELADTGYAGEALQARATELEELGQTRLEREGVAALFGASHAQYLLTAAARAALGPVTGVEALSAREDRAFDDLIDGLGLLRLSPLTKQYRHVGNRMGDEDRAELARLGEAAGSRERRPLRSGVWRRYPVRRAATRLHDATFRILYESDRP